MPDRSAPLLLTTPDDYGTLAAARCLGGRGVPIVVADPQWLTPARWSRYVRKYERIPPASAVDELIDWLVRYGNRNPGYVLYPTSDDLAWLIAAHASELGRHYRLYSPTAENVLHLLDKKQLYETSEQAGIRVPRTWFPRDVHEAGTAAAEATLPLVIKPRTQTLLASRVKGEVVHERGEVVRRYQQFAAKNPHHARLVERLPDIGQPMLQEFSQEGGRVYSISGFRTADGDFVTRASYKVLQWPRRVGVGICFEDASVDEALAAQVRALCVKTGYFGVFEVEFVSSRGEWMLIDFNPRFFGQMGFDIARGLPSAYLAYLGATGDHVTLANEIAGARDYGRTAQRSVYSNRFAVTWTLMLERLAGRAGSEDARRWRRWYTVQDTVHTEAVIRAADPLPGIVDTAQQLLKFVRHPRSQWRAAKR